MLRFFCAALCLVLAPAIAAAQQPGVAGVAGVAGASGASGASGSSAAAGPGMPPHFPLNPMAVSRTGLFAQPYTPAAPGWTRTISVDYASAAEWEEAVDGARYVLDAEFMRAQLILRRDISPHRFVQFVVDANGVFDGFADGAFDWYHNTMGISFRGREQRPSNEFRYSLSLPESVEIERERPDYYLGDVQLHYGIRHGTRHQTLLALTLPTATAPPGYSKDSYSLSAIHTLRGRISSRFSYEATLGAGYAPAGGALAAIQNEFFNSASAAMNFRISERHSIYGYLFTHSALYSATSLPELHSRELTGDLGWRGRTASGREWRIGFTEDFGPSDAGVDLILRFGVTW
jgi:hypothetical protein